ncbi:hypothetical protein A2316_02935 [Candidatus Falkowbacteria bacterium RIFOXYB2_FULL_38_15]|uniref:DUF3048 domain-containing protein n=1 Tax=Candidatus Falkowbacteria bacterium RIFOXYA2_FULL_38_12 TaxID=1797993 RepID=A0A1F5S478_9BACT|nr:MAG: hypothetical protein A2257_01555 [Candidatus Falkowbacteria bacterium RIFOXYA2_FULL_38_12]OGF32460.1 MAG: hypothetical protein A2316_02935 [Candidatus Falkowbacteria bacterium RIFOXYB2_FULL_38_15]OGF42419.1 MAG: hypothetical protein A2555_00540 [Candidatus Falkowbacteria bacterium RIFOXYD2_FULL_39_16]
MRRKFQQIITFIKKQPKLWLVVFLLVFTSLSGVIFYNIFFPKEVIVKEEEKVIEEESGPVRLLDGIAVQNESEINPPIFAVQVENMVDSWPLSGLSRADLVYETLVEAGITRFLALFTEGNSTGAIGPVRSARPYYIDWAEEYGALYAHSGGSPEALQIVSGYNVLNVDEFANGKYFWRETSRYAPHNLYTSSDLLSQAFINKEAKVKDNFEAWQFKDEAVVEFRPENSIINIDFSSVNYLAKWQYLKDENSYLRYQGEKIKKDKEGGEIKVKNIVVQFTEIIVLDDVGRKKIKTIGSGEAIIFQDGIKIEGEWKKEKRGDRTRFYDRNGVEIKFNPGVTWIEVAPIGTEITFE